MSNMNVYSLTEIFKQADAFSKKLDKNGKVEYIELGVQEKGGVLILVHYKVDKVQYLGSFNLK
ncbi:MAG: hypothetical protein GY820_38495 [Gammaproteobacteria bacterium]|nr:hypothetical protein [Gammaproteobacteria bacterium]